MKYMQMPLLQSKFLARFLHVMTEKWENLKDTPAYHRVSYIRIETDSLLQTILCPVYHWLSVIYYLYHSCFRARDIST